MRFLRNEDGIALMTALMFTLLSLGMIMMLMYYVLAGTRMSAAHKRYRNSLEASYGGTEFVTKTIIPRLLDLNLSFALQKAALETDFSERYGILFSAGLENKLTKATSEWDAGVSKTVNPKEAPDVTFTLNGTTAGGNFTVYSKIVDTVPGVGLIDTSGIDYLDGGLGVAGSSSSTATLRTPSIYSLEVQGERASGAQEKAALSVLYAY
jgi:hypothetical protein